MATTSCTLMYTCIILVCIYSGAVETSANIYIVFARRFTAVHMTISRFVTTAVYIRTIENVISVWHPRKIRSLVVVIVVACVHTGSFLLSRGDCSAPKHRVNPITVLKLKKKSSLTMHSGFLLNGPWTGGRVTNLIRIHPRLIGQRTKRIRMCACVGLSGGLRGDDDASSRYTGAALERKPRSRVPSYHTYCYYLFFLFQNAYYACYRIIASGLRYRFITYYYAYAYKSDKFNIVITTIQQCSNV